MNIIYNPNQLRRDDYGRPSGLILIDKPVGFTSHDVVNVTRKALNTKKVGHAGALDPFATGLMIVLVGKATRLSDTFMSLDKSYEAEILFGISTSSQDTEGKIIKTWLPEYTKEDFQTDLNNVIEEVSNGYDQFVPVFSSVKVDGQKLRVLARRYSDFETYFEDGKKFVRFTNSEDNKEKIIELPIHRIDFTQLKSIGIKHLPLIDILDQSNEFHASFISNLKNHDESLLSQKFFIAKIITDCPKGTYIRQLAEDIGEKLNGTPAMLISLNRSRVGNYHLEDAKKIDELSSL